MEMREAGNFASQLNHIRPYLQKYCLTIARNNWEADDLLQETLLRLMRVLQQDPNKVLSKAYVYRTVLNLWRDERRKQQKRPSETLEEEQVGKMIHIESQYETRELLELLAHQLAPKHLVVLLLMEVFHFTAKETAVFLASTEGAIQITLSRARSKLKTLSLLRQVETEVSLQKKHKEEERLDPTIFEAILNGFRTHNAKAIYSAYLRLQEQGIRIQHIQSSHGKWYFTFQDPDGNMMMISS